MLPEWIWVYDKSYNFYFDTKKKITENDFKVIK